MQSQETFHEALGQPCYPPFLQLNDEGTPLFFTKEAFFSPSKRLQVFPGHNGRVGDLPDPQSQFVTGPQYIPACLPSVPLLPTPAMPPSPLFCSQSFFQDTRLTSMAIGLTRF